MALTDELSNLTGEASESAKTALESYVEEAESAKNKAINDIQNDLKDKAKSVGEKLKNKFNFGGLLDKLSSLLDGLPFGDALKNSLSNFINNSINKFKNSLLETTKALMKAAEHLVNSSLDKLINVALSHIALPDFAYLVAIQALYLAGSDLAYNNNYARKTAIRCDYPMTLKWIDETLGFTYGIIESSEYAKATSVLSSAASNSCVKVFLYVLDKLKKDYNTINSNIKSYEAQIYNIEKVEIKGYEDTITRLEIEYNQDDTTEVRREEIDVLIELEKSKIKNAEKNVTSLNKELESWERLRSKYRNLVAQYTKKLLVYSVGNITKEKFHDVLRAADLIPAVFGDYDPEFNNRYSIKTADVDRMAPFYENPKGFIEKTQDYLGDTRLVKTSKLPEYIILRNIWLKYIYIMLSSPNIYGLDNQLSSQVLYERLCYPTADFLTDQLNEAAGYLVDDGIGRDIMDALLALDAAIYDFTKLSEKLLVSPPEKEYLQLPSYGQTMPEPLVPYDDPIPPLNDEPSENIDIAGGRFSSSKLTQLLQYYLTYIDSANRYIFFKDLYTEIKKLYDKSLGNEFDLAFYTAFIKYYFSSNSLNEDFNVDEYFKSFSQSVLFNNYNETMQSLYFKKYKSQFAGITEESTIVIDLNKVFLDNYTKLKQEATKYILAGKSEAELYSHLLFIYNIMGDKAVRYTTYTETIMTFLRKYYTEDAYKPSFYIENYLNSLNKEQKLKTLTDLLVEMEYLLINDSKWKNLKDIYNKIFEQIFPAYGTVINLEGSNNTGSGSSGSGSDNSDGTTDEDSDYTGINPEETPDNIDINDPSIIEQIEEDMKNYDTTILPFSVWIRDFDNKLIDLKNWQSIETDLNNENFEYDEKYGYKIFLQNPKYEIKDE